MPGGVCFAQFSSRLPSACSISERRRARAAGRQATRRSTRCAARRSARRVEHGRRDFVERRPVAFEPMRARFEARHLQQLGDMLRHLARLAEHALCQRVALVLRSFVRHFRRGSTRRPPSPPAACAGRARWMRAARSGCARSRLRPQARPARRRCGECSRRDCEMTSATASMIANVSRYWSRRP